MNEDLGGTLTDAVYPAYPLLYPHRVPGDIEIDQRIAGLKVQSFAGCVCAHQDAQRVLFVPELLLYLLLAAGGPSPPVPVPSTGTGIGAQLIPVLGTQVVQDVFDGVHVLTEHDDLSGSGTKQLPQQFVHRIGLGVRSQRPQVVQEGVQIFQLCCDDSPNLVRPQVPELLRAFIFRFVLLLDLIGNELVQIAGP